MDDQKFINVYFKDIKMLIEKLEPQNRLISDAIRLLFDAWKENKHIFLIGNGGSASTASHFAADLAKTINDIPGMRGIRALTPWDNTSLISAIVNDRLKENYFTSWLDTYYVQGGIGIGITVHGGSGSDFGGKWSQNLLESIRFIKNRGGKTIGFSGFDGGKIKDLVDICIVVPADSTSLVESMHVFLHHLIVFRLKELINSCKNKDFFYDRG